MERCDFCSVMAIIRKNIGESYDISQTDLLYELFAAFANDEQNYEYVFDNGLVCRWFKGAAKISPQITRYYTDEHNKKRLSSDIEKRILPLMVDSDMAMQEIYDLIVFDTTISDGAKQRLTSGYPFPNSKEKADFLSAVLCFSMERNFIKREAGSKKLTAGKALSPIVNDVIFGADVPQPCRWFCGRDKELDALHDQLSENSKTFLQGIPGIGKSELAKAYAKKHKKDYTNIIYINYSGNLKADIVNLDFADDYNANEPEAERFRRHNRFLRSLKDDSLIIVDNFNAIATDDELLNEILAYSCRILFTTRSHFDDYDTYTIEEMPDDALLELMGKLFTDADKYQAILSEIIHTVHGHTFAVELAARLLEVGILAPDQLLEKLRTEKAAMDSEDKVSARKDGKSKKATYYTHIHTLFSLYKLSSAETYIMCNLALAPRNGIAAKLIALWLKLENMNFINELIERGFVQLLPGQIIVLHPMIQEIALDETKPSVTKCNTLLKRIQHICLRHGEDVLYYRQLFDTIETIIDLIENDDIDFYLRFLEDVFPYMEKYEFSNLRHTVAEKLYSLLSDDAVGTISDRALLLDYRATLEKDVSKAIGYEKQAIAMINEVTAENVHLICNLYTNLANLYHQNDDISLALNSLEKAIRFAKRFNIIRHHDNIVRIYNYSLLLVSSGDIFGAVRELQNLSKLIETINSTKSLDYAMVQEKLGEIISLVGDKRQAFNHFKTAFEIYEIYYASDLNLLEEKRRKMILYLNAKLK
ncbi:MAG: Archaeal ATPase [Ruminococcus sp.]|nr:Archaeal ATPase [Ruminococcus sp.]